MTFSLIPLPPALYRNGLPVANVIYRNNYYYYLRLLDKTRCQTTPGYMHTV